MKLVVEIIAGLTLILMALVIGYGLWFLIRIPTKRWRAGAFDFVYVNDDGSVRELHREEEAQLNSLFFVGDPPDCYLKPRYESQNPSGDLSGYLKRRLLPKALKRQLPVKKKKEV